MKKFVILLVAGILIYACNPNHEETIPADLAGKKSLLKMKKQELKELNEMIAEITDSIKAQDPAFEEKFESLLWTYVKPQIEQFMGRELTDMDDAAARLEYWAMPLEDIHLYSNLNFEIEPNGNIQYVYIFSIIGFFVLFIACINFMNLATARSSRASTPTA